MICSGEDGRQGSAIPSITGLPTKPRLQSVVHGANVIGGRELQQLRGIAETANDEPVEVALLSKTLQAGPGDVLGLSRPGSLLAAARANVFSRAWLRSASCSTAAMSRSCLDAKWRYSPPPPGANPAALSISATEGCFETVLTEQSQRFGQETNTGR